MTVFQKEIKAYKVFLRQPAALTQDIHLFRAHGQG